MTAPRAMIHVTPEMIHRFKTYYEKPGNGAGGSLHIVLEDGNVDDLDVRCCIMYAMERNDEDGVNLGQLLLKLSKSQRLKIGRSF